MFCCGSGKISRNRLHKESRHLSTSNIGAAALLNSDLLLFHAVDWDDEEDTTRFTSRRGSSLISEEGRETIRMAMQEEAQSEFNACSDNDNVFHSRFIDQGSSSFDSETDSSNPSMSDSDQVSAQTKWRVFLKLLKKKSSTKSGYNFNANSNINVPKLSRKKGKKHMEVSTPHSCRTDVGFCHLKSSWRNFSLMELQTATNNFSSDNLIGEGGYSKVFKGKLEDGNLIAIKQLKGEMSDETTVEFLSELGIIVHVNHPNIAKLIGYGIEGGMHLVLELSPCGSLSSFLCGSKEKLSWNARCKIAKGTAEGLFYLHEGCQRRIIHKDIKAANILLTKDFEPQICDFGLAKWLPEQWTHHVESKIEGTFGYLPPEFFMHGIVDEKTDVFAFGVLLLELITGRMALDKSQKSLVLWAKPLIANNSIHELADPSLASAYDLEQMKRMIMTASLCIHESPEARPQMKDVMKVIRGDHGSQQLFLNV